MKTGKYYITPNENPSFNMAFDEWLFTRLMENRDNCRAVIRLYSWCEPAITIGYNQNIDRAIDREQLENDYTAVIRRITGGRAIYHDPDELTYTVMFDLSVFPEDSQSIADSSRLISETFVQIFDKIGIKTEWAEKSDNSFKSAGGINLKSCFNSLSRFEIMSEHSKIAAGAQRRVGHYFIQQGSLKVNGISGCAAIGQSERMLKSVDRDAPANFKKYKIDDFSMIMGKLFSDNFGIDFKRTELIESERRNMEVFWEKFKSKKTEKR
ncbi:MAG: hypothetical protein ABIJ45_00730 [Candidatus Zixiibacteriota bacterium]